MTTVKYNVIVKPSPNKEKSLGGIIVPDSAQVRPNKATVVSSGDGCEFNEGDIVYHLKGQGEPFVEKEIVYYVLTSDAILAKAV